VNAQLNLWLQRATSMLEALQRFATEVYEDYDAVKAGVTLPWEFRPRRGAYQPPEDAEALDVKTKLGVLQQRLQPVGFGLGPGWWRWQLAIVDLAGIRPAFVDARNGGS
jgi:hypothetical protein